MVQRFPSSLATVRLMPSIEIDPLNTVYFSISGGISICSHQFSESRPSESTMRSSSISLPTPSTCPWTMWPSKRPLAFIGSSRFTSAPSWIRENDVRTHVSGARSAQNDFGLMASAVRQTPLTAMLWPVPNSFGAFAASMVMRRFSPCCSIFTTLPTSSIIPVNIGRIPPQSRPFHTYGSRR